MPLLADLPDGYNMYCDTLRNELTTEECIAEAKAKGNFSCSTGIPMILSITPLRIRCPGPHEEFKLSGCYNLDQGEGDSPTENDPTDDQLAERYIKHFSSIRLEPIESRYSLDSDGKVLKWSSAYSDKLSKQYDMVRWDSSNGLH